MSDQYQRIKNALDIIDIVGELIRLRRVGANYVGKCPFHDDHNASMYVSRAKQMFKCFACDTGGDVFTFVEEYFKFTKYEALCWCAKKAGIEIEQPSKENIEKYQRQESLQATAAEAAEFFQSHLCDGADFLAKRGYSLDNPILAKYGVGYAPEGNVLKKDFKTRGVSEQSLIDVNVTAKSPKGFTYDVFQDRIIFPFYDISGHPIGFTGRMVKDRENAGKYQNTGETDLYHKGDNLYGLFQAKNAISRADKVYLMEGQFDVLSMAANGVENVVAGSGTALTDAQVKLISRFCKNVVLCYDSDKAGIKASLKSCELLLEAGLGVEAIQLPDGIDPDDFAQEHTYKTKKELESHIVDIITYFGAVLQRDDDSMAEKDKFVQKLCKMAAKVKSNNLRYNYCRKIAEVFKAKEEAIERTVKTERNNLPQEEDMKPGIYGLEDLANYPDKNEACLITDELEEFVEASGQQAAILVKGVPDYTQIQTLRSTWNYFTCSHKKLGFVGETNVLSQEMDITKALVQMFTRGIENIQVLIPGKVHNDQAIEDGETDEEGYETNPNYTDTYSPFINEYISLYGLLIKSDVVDKSVVAKRCAEVIAYADDSVRIVNFSKWQKALGLGKAALEKLIAPYLEKRKGAKKLSAQRSDDEDEYEDISDPNEIPSYVEENDLYKKMLRQCGYFPKVNKKGIPLCYMFINEKGGITQVGDFFMEPLLHIYSDNPDENKRVIKINRRYYKTPLFIEVTSKALLRKASIEEQLINLEAVNFTNGTDYHWVKIREFMSRHFITCTEVEVYGNQQEDGTSKRLDEQFFAFANGIYHHVDGKGIFTASDELGVCTHENKNYYLPAFSTIYAGSGKNSDKYEMIEQLVYKPVPEDKQVSFKEWATLMDQVYSINNNGKWAILFAVMSAFRSNIHSLDRMFTAPFFMGPMSGGKTQIAISIRSLFVSPKISIFNLNTGSDAALATLMSTFRDVPIVLDEYNNKDITDNKFQALKGIVYDGDGKQKRKAAGTKDIEIDKVYAPVIICGQETPQRDDNALMSRVIVCEVSKPKGQRTKEQIDRFNKLKEIEDPNKIGLSNVLLDVLNLRPAVMDNFRKLKKECYENIKEKLSKNAEIDRLMKTVSLFLATCRLIEEHSSLELPFTYNEFEKIALDKIQFQAELINTTDKLAIFFKCMDWLVDQRAVRYGREYDISPQEKITIQNGKEQETISFSESTKVMYIRLSNVFLLFAKSTFNSENATQSTIQQNLRSHPAYIGQVKAHKFSWEETQEVAMGTTPMTDNENNMNMIKTIKKMHKNTSCIAINYDIFQELYGIDLEEHIDEDSRPHMGVKKILPPTADDEPGEELPY